MTINVLEFFKLLFSDPEDDYEENNIQLSIDKRFLNKPCQGDIEDTGSHCKGCKFEKEHTN